MAYSYAPAEAGIVFIEMQPEIVRTTETISVEALSKATAALTGAAKILGIPIFASGVQFGPDKAPSFGPELKGHPMLLRKSPGVLDEPDIAEKIKAAGCKVLAIAGMSSEMAVLHTVHSALRQGYDVHVIVDACVGLSARIEQAAFQQVQAAGAKLSSVSSFLVRFIQDQNE